MNTKQKPTITRADARARFLDNILPHVRAMQAGFAAAVDEPNTPDPANVKLIAEEGGKIFALLDGKRSRARRAARGK
jgi:hypothetical protein